MMRMTGKIKLSTMKKNLQPKICQPVGVDALYTYFGSFYTICDFPLCYSWTTVTIRFGFYFIYFSARVKYCLVNSYKMWQFKQRGKNGDFERYGITVNSESIVGWPQSKQLWRDVGKKRVASKINKSRYANGAFGSVVLYKWVCGAMCYI